MKRFNNIAIIATACATFFVLGLAVLISAFAQTAPSLGMAATYGVLANTYTDISAGTTINGDVGFTTAPATAPAGVHTHYGSGAPYSQAGTDQGAALPALAAEPCTFTFAGGAVDLSTDTTHGAIGVYAPGVYCSSGAMNIGGPITLSGSGTYIFRPVGALTSAAGSVVTLSGGASACNVFWTPSAATTLAANTTFVGIDIDDSGITVGSTVIWTGNALAYNGTVTTAADNITVPTCSVPPPTPATLHVVKIVVNANGSTAVPSDFTLHVEASSTDVAGSPAPGVAASGTAYTLAAGTYTVSENVSSSYTESITGDCAANGTIALVAGQNATCTITNTNNTIAVASSTPVSTSTPTSTTPTSTFTPAPTSTSYVSAVGTGGGRIMPVIGILKVPTPLALPAGSGSVTYNYTVWNVGGQQSLDDVSVADNACSPVVYVSGDLNNNSKLDPGEYWKYSCTMKLTTTTTNTAVATGYSDDTYHQAALATAIATVVVGESVTPPIINIIKVPSRLTPFPYGGGAVAYTYTVTNPGVVPIHNVVVTDDKCSPVSYVSGDVNGNDLLDPGEIWIYTCKTNISASTSNTATVEGTANGLTAVDYAFATVLVSAPGLPNTGFPPERDSTPWEVVAVVGLCVLGFASFIVALRKRGI